MSLDDLLDKLWDDYAGMNKQAGKIHDLLTKKGERVVNDHIAFRTFNLPKVGIDALAKHFTRFGYRPKGEYEFKEKKLFAKHFEHSEEGRPIIFISELKVDEFSATTQNIIKELVSASPQQYIDSDDFLVSGVVWDAVSYDTYLQLKEESEYAAWLSAFGFRANHFTLLFNELESFEDFEQFNQYLVDQGFKLNDSGGLIKGTPKEYLEQSSTMAYPVKVEFSDVKETIPACYYEFAKRYPLPDGKLFMGFVTGSADKIFESTDNK